MASKLEGGAYLSSFVDAISEKLSSILEDVSILEGDYSAQKLLETLDDCLCDVAPVLDDAELKQLSDKRVKKWLVDLQDALYMADDLLDELSTKAATANPRDPGNSSLWSRAVDSCIEDSGVNVNGNIVGTLESLVKRKDKLGLEKSAKLDTSWRIQSTSVVVSSDIFGRDQDKENIIKLLLDDTCDAESLVTVIPIVGIGGIGKTTLAQLVYNDARVVGKFDTKAWVCFAENPNPVNLTKTIIGSIGSYPRNLDHFDSLQTDLKEKLTGKTFLVVLDDVWHDQPHMWEDFLKPFRFENNRGKILLTTRSEKVASVFAPNNLHSQLSLLSNEDCWSVFLKHSSISTNSKQYAILESIGRKFVEKCKGLPLAVKTLGGLFAISIIKGIGRIYLNVKSGNSLTMTDYEFDKDELILLWMAEDLLQPKENNTLKNIGCAYFDELVARSFFQPSSTKSELFVMHDLIHDLATFFAGKFYLKLEEFENLHVVDSKIRHLSFSLESWDIITPFGEACKRAVHLRTALDFSSYGYGESFDVESNAWLLQQQLRVLSFPIESLPDSIGELIYLRYLNLSGTRIVTLPESICELYNLQTLMLRNCYELEMLPSRMQDLVNLQHLDIRGVSLKEMPKKMSKLKHLNFLSYYIIGEHEENGIRELGTLDNLHGSFHILNLENVKNSDEALEAKMGNKKHINTLKLEWLPGGYSDDVETERDILEELEPHENLKELSIEGYRGETFPDWLGLSRYSSMTELILNSVSCCELPSLGQLPSLQHLELSNFYSLVEIGLEFYNKNNGSFQQETPFKSLETLEFHNMYSWEEWHFPDEFDGFPKLRSLSMRYCPRLRGSLPAHLPALEELTIAKCSELVCSLPRAPKIQQLDFGNYGAPPHTLGISKTQLHSLRVQCLEIHVEDCDSLTLLPLEDLPNLQKLTIGKCPSMEYVKVPQALPGLRYLSISDCPSLVSLPALGLAAPHLEDLLICDCPEIDCFADECLPPSLKNLHVKQCQKLSRWITSKGLQSHGRLTRLDLREWFDVKSFPREGWLPASLESLTLLNFPNLETLDCKGLHHLVCLKELTIGYCKKLANITEEYLLPSIAKIRMGRKCPLTSKLEEMEDPPPILFDTFYDFSDDEDDYR